MSLEQEWLTTTVDDRSVYHRYIRHTETPADGLLVLLPGHGYTSDMPLLYYLRAAALQAAWDTLSITYAFQAHRDYSGSRLLHEIRLVLDLPAIQNAGYRRLCFAAKSLGTPLAVELAHQQTPAETSLILLTPIMDAPAQVEQTPTLAVIGTADRYYDAASVRETGAAPNLHWLVLEGLDHGLEMPDDWKTSIKMLQRVTSACATFLREREA
jgi:hypothetical protein